MCHRIRLCIFEVLIILAFSFSLYTWKIYQVAESVRIYEEPPILVGPHWVCTGYRLFPIPYTPADTGLTSLMVITPLTPTDAFIYETLVKTWILVVVTAGLWVITGYYGIHVLRRLEDAYEKRFASIFTLFVIGTSCMTAPTVSRILIPKEWMCLIFFMFSDIFLYLFIFGGFLSLLSLHLAIKIPSEQKN